MNSRKKWDLFFRKLGSTGFLFLISIVMLVFGLITVFNPSQGFAETLGTVKEVKWHEEDNKNPVEILFRFEVDGVGYDGVYTFGATDYEPGDAIMVYYDPKDPTVTTPRIGNPLWGWLMVGIGAAFLLYSGFFIRKVYLNVKNGPEPSEEDEADLYSLRSRASLNTVPEEAEGPAEQGTAAPEKPAEPGEAGPGAGSETEEPEKTESF